MNYVDVRNPILANLTCISWVGVITFISCRTCAMGYVSLSYITGCWGLDRKYNQGYIELATIESDY